MITAKEWLAAAALNDDEAAQFEAALREIATEATRVRREYGGFKVTMPLPAITPNVAAAIRIHFAKDGWDVQPHQMQQQTALAGVQVMWVILIMPNDAVSSAAAVRFKGREN